MVRPTDARSTVRSLRSRHFNGARRSARRTHFAEVRMLRRCTVPLTVCTTCQGVASYFSLRAAFTACDAPLSLPASAVPCIMMRCPSHGHGARGSPAGEPGRPGPRPADVDQAAVRGRTLRAMCTATRTRPNGGPGPGAAARGAGRSPPAPRHPQWRARPLNTHTTVSDARPPRIVPGPHQAAWERASLRASPSPFFKVLFRLNT